MMTIPSICLSIFLALQLLFVISSSFKLPDGQHLPQPEWSEQDITMTKDGVKMTGRSIRSMPTPQNNKKKFVFFDQKATWVSAYNNCRSQKQNLAYIRNKEEQDQLETMIIAQGKVEKPFWISFQLQPSHVKFYGLNSKPAYEEIQWAKWDDNEPKRKSNDDQCATVQHTGKSFKWVAQPCDSHYNYVCEEFEEF